MSRIPDIPFIQGVNSYSDVDGQKWGIAIHCTDNDASDTGEAGYGTWREDGTSAHLYADRDSVTQSLDTHARAGHAGSDEGNDNALAVEITGRSTWSRQTWIDNVAWAQLARALAWVIDHDPHFARGLVVTRASVAEMKRNPRVQRFYGHDDMRLAWGHTDHTDPGPNFPWDLLFASVTIARRGGKRETMFRIQAEDRPHVYLSNGAHVPNTTVDKQLAELDIPLLKVKTTAELQALMPPAQAAPTIDYGKLAKEIVAEAFARS
ncbi:MAG TPA: N-acetylmuramoyl-L-alanine amidase [Rariglobus sp.]